MPIDSQELPSPEIPKNVRKVLVQNYLAVPMDERERVWLVAAVAEERRQILEEMTSWEQYGAENYGADLENDCAGAEREYYSDFSYSRKQLESILNLEAQLYNTFGFESCFSGEDCSRIDESRTGSAEESARSLERSVVFQNIHWLGTASKTLASARAALEEAQQKSAEHGNVNGPDYDEEYYELQDKLEEAEAEFERVEIIASAIWMSFSDLKKVPKMKRLIPEACRDLDRAELEAWYKATYEAPKKPVDSDPDILPKSILEDDYDDDIPF